MKHLSKKRIYIFLNIFLSFILFALPMRQVVLASVGEDTGSLSLKKLVEPGDSEDSDKEYVFSLKLAREVNHTIKYISEGTLSATYTDTVPGNTLYKIKTGAETGFSYEKYEISAWNTKPDGTGEDYAPGTEIMVKKDMVLYAQWQYTGTYIIVSYLGNGGAGSYADTQVIPGSDYKVKSVSETGVTRENWTFTGWNTAFDGSGQAYHPNEIIKLSGTIMLFAQWQYSGNYIEVNYLDNYAAGSYTDAGLIPGNSYTIKNPTETGISRTDWTFTGWNTASDGSGMTYREGDALILTENLTLYAQWEYPIINVSAIHDSGEKVYNAANTDVPSADNLPDEEDEQAYETYSIPDFDKLKASLAEKGISIEETGPGSYRIILKNGESVSLPDLENGVKYSVTEIGYLDDNGNVVDLDNESVKISVSGGKYLINGTKVSGTIIDNVEIVYTNFPASEEETTKTTETTETIETTTKTPEVTQIPKTGDNSHLSLYLPLAAFSLAALFHAKKSKIKA